MEPDLDDALDDHVGDDLLRLIFTACHPVLSPRPGWRWSCGCSAACAPTRSPGPCWCRSPQWPNASSGPSVRLTGGTPFELPPPAELAARLEAVLEVVYLIFNEGYSATAGDDWMRPALCEEALRLGRVLGGLMPRQCRGARPDRADGAAGLPACRPARARTASRSCCRTRTAADGTGCSSGAAWPRWPRAEELGGAYRPYPLQAAIAACHARAPRRRGDRLGPDRRALPVLGHISPSPVVELNRAVAVGHADGAAAGLAIVDGLAGERVLAGYPFLPAVRGDLLAQLGRHDEARAEFERAAELTRNARQRRSSWPEPPALDRDDRRVPPAPGPHDRPPLRVPVRPAGPAARRGGGQGARGRPAGMPQVTGHR